MKQQNIHSPFKIQTKEAYRKDPVVKHLEERLLDLSKKGFKDVGLAELMIYREKWYPDLFPRSVNVTEKAGQGEVLRAYIEFLKEQEK